MIRGKKTNTEWVAQANRDSKAMGKLKGSITHGEGNPYAFVGEITLCNAIGGTRNNTYQHDILTRGGKRVEVKTMRCSGEPKSYYNCKVCMANTSQACDYYAFTRVSYDMSMCWLVGYLPREEFYKLAVPADVGEYDTNNNVHGYFEKHACYNLPIDKLRDVKDLVFL